jgi:hypothetical protein
VLAEGEELGSNLLYVAQSSPGGLGGSGSLKLGRRPDLSSQEDGCTALRLPPAAAERPTRTRRATAMRLQTYRDESRSRHFDLTGGRRHPWSIDLVAVTASGILVVGFACVLVALWVH